jgi:hypothetical protein
MGAAINQTPPSQPKISAYPQTTITKLFFQDISITVAIATFLLIVLLIVVQITATYRGPLQAKT